MTKQSSKKTTPPQPKAVEGGSVGTSRSRTLERRQERQKQKRQQRNFTYIILAAVLAIAAVGIFIVINQPASAPIPEGTLDRYEGIPQAKNDKGFYVLGKPDAPVRVEEFSSFSCAHCAEYHDSTFDSILDQVRAGIISFTYIPLTAYGTIPNSEGASQAAICAGEQGMFFEMHDALFNWHRTYGNQAFTQNRILTGIENLTLNRSLFDSCFGSSRVEGTLSDAVNEAQDRGVTGTPTLFVNGNLISIEDNLEDRVQEALATTGITPIPLEIGDDVEQPEATLEATPEASEPTEEATEAVDTTAGTESGEETAEATTEGNED